MEPWDNGMIGDDAPDVGQGPDTERTSVRWSRPDPPEFNPNKDALIFQQIDIDHYNGLFLFKKGKKIEYGSLIFYFNFFRSSITRNAWKSGCSGSDNEDVWNHI